MEQELRARFVAVVESHGPAIRRLAEGFERDPARREELVQDVLLAVWTALPGFRDEAKLRTWVLRIAHNRAASHVATRVRDRSTPVAETPDAAEEAGVEDAVERSRQRARLARLVRELPVPDRQLMLLYLEGLTAREIGEVTGRSVTSVTSRVSRIKESLIRDLRAEAS